MKTNTKNSINTICLMGMQKSSLSWTRYIFCLLVIGLFLLATAPATAATYYLDANNGNDTNPGTSESPWKTLNRAYTWYSGAGTKVQEGDTVLIRNGSYGTFQESTNINPGADYLFYRSDWIIYKADTGHSPVLTSIDIKNKDKWEGAGDGSSYLHLEGFTIDDGIVIENTSYVKIIDCDIQTDTADISGFYEPYFVINSPAITAYIETFYVTIQDNEISNAFRGMSVGGSHIVITGNTIHHVSEDGLGMVFPDDEDDILIDNNLIYDMRGYTTSIDITGTYNAGTFSVGEAVQQGMVTGIVASSTATLAKIYATTEAVFTVGGGDITGGGAPVFSPTIVDAVHTDAFQLDSARTITNLVITNNILDRKRPGKDAGEGIEDGQALKVWGYNENISCTIKNNLIVGGTPLLIQGLNNAIFNNNTCHGSPPPYSGSTFRNINGSMTVAGMYNNIIEYLFVNSDSGSKTITITHGNNIFGTVVASDGFTANGTELVGQDIDALFTETTDGDFSLAAGSTAIGYADPEHAPSTDITGASRDANPDAGCYEYGSSDNEEEEEEEEDHPE